MAPTPQDPGPLPEAIEEAVLAALDGAESARDDRLRELLQQHAAHAPALRRWLLASGVTVPDLPDVPVTVSSVGGPTGSTDPLDRLPQRLGAYLLQHKLGRGGFGTVFRAEQLEPIRRPVAVKVLNPGMDSREVLARFAAEREALNRMDHVGIARLLDAGTTPQGRPFFVMELVDGPPLATWCRQRSVPLRRRIELFLLVLDAMQHAHQKAVLHRDLSSNNVLVAGPDDRPQPKIIDFGIAKSLADPLLHGGPTTFRGTLMGTPEFMSPEQAAGNLDDVDTRGDVYALGVQLYELLTDHLPLPSVLLRAQGLAGMTELIQNHRPPPPSEAAPRDRRAALRGDLDGIVGKAIAKARDERYPTIAEFAADLRRHLADEPVQVAAPTTWYRLRKFVRRNRVQSLAIATVAIGLVAGLSVALLGLHEAQRAGAEEAQLRREMQSKANAGFRLLVHEPELQHLVETADRLPPPFADHGAEYAAWLVRAEALAAAAQQVEAQRRALAAAAPGDDADAYLSWALARLGERLAAFFGPHGPRERIAERARWRTDIAVPAAAAHAADWRTVAREIRERAGGPASYGGLLLEPLGGLVPLGRDPATQLHEFLDLCSHPAGAPPPLRDAAGRLAVGADTGVVFVLLPPGTQLLGARRGRPGMPQDDPHADADELDGKVVWLDAFLCARTEVTRAQWRRLQRIGGAAGTPDADDDLPQTGVDWQQAMHVLAGAGMVLPTEAQWEFACRAYTSTPWAWGAEAATAVPMAWFGPQVQPVARLQPNAFGLFDLHGNAAEWCRDEFLPYLGTKTAMGSGLRQRAEAGGDVAPRQCAVRGGACVEGPIASRSSARRGLPPDTRDLAIGLRPVRLLRGEPGVASVGR
jgi:serine/threonine protein kinase/formylglycine-generating enzyme required for sulfatase activity